MFDVTGPFQWAILKTLYDRKSWLWSGADHNFASVEYDSWLYSVIYDQGTWLNCEKTK